PASILALSAAVSSAAAPTASSTLSLHDALPIFKYTPEHGGIVVAVRREGAAAVFEVRDSGIGIPDDEKDQVFQRFYRVGKSRSLDRKSTRLNSSHVKISYAVFCLKKKKIAGEQA